MTAEQYLIAGNVVVWCGLGGYVLFLATRLSGLERRLARLLALRGEGEDE
ncbi:hypothetical protein dsx2_2720 [Desulfovibrio sp. X2]|nr:CcmD family protein [Desulfovibrio sp. X2]EPR42803.1 hypothetical protein dsx2_2720 [Desulfovibrio sp. X2]